jgi:hypothetical protein
MAIVVITLCSACAARTAQPSTCEPVPAEFALVGQTVYRDCDVDRKARSPRGVPRLHFTPSAGQTCFRAIIDVVVDSTGRPVPETARVARSTDPSFAAAAVNSLEGMRYEPALKDGRPVPQLVRVDLAMIGVRAAGAAGPLRRPPRGPPPC